MGRPSYDINHHAFDEIDRHGVYWLGFLLADGNVYKSRISGFRPSVRADGNILKTAVGGEKAERLGGHLYANPDPALNRKALTVIENYGG